MNILAMRQARAELDASIALEETRLRREARTAVEKQIADLQTTLKEQLGICTNRRLVALFRNLDSNDVMAGYSAYTSLVTYESDDVCVTAWRKLQAQKVKLSRMEG